MSVKKEIQSVWGALRRGSPVVVHLPAEIRLVLLRRYMEMSMQNGRLGLACFGLLLFGLAHAAPLWPRLAAWALLAAVFSLRVWRARVMERTLDEQAPRSDRIHDLLLLVASASWGFAPMAFQPWLSPFNLFCVIYAAFVATAMLAITYVAALPACFVLVGASVLPLVVFMATQGSMTLAMLALGTFICTVAMLMRVHSAHATLLQALAAERQNAELVYELQSYRHALETENATLDSSLRAASRAAHRDPLTGLFNRRHIVSYAGPLAELVRLGREKITLCVVDVDHFKKVNDCHGHAVGDEVLRAISGLLGARLREGDCLARIGGEEFLIVLRRCDASRGRRVAESVRHNVAASQIATAIGEVPVTVSLGVAEWAADEDFNAAFARADRALYDAKHSGRDRVEMDGADAMRMSTIPTDLITLPGILH